MPPKKRSLLEHHRRRKGEKRKVNSRIINLDNGKGGKDVITESVSEIASLSITSVPRCVVEESLDKNIQPNNASLGASVVCTVETADLESGKGQDGSASCPCAIDRIGVFESGKRLGTVSPQGDAGGRCAFEDCAVVEQGAFLNGLHIVRGTFAQSSERFSNSGRDRQCTAMAVVAIAYHWSVTSVNRCRTNDVDTILCYGDKLYTQSVRLLGPDRLDDQPLYLTISEVHRIFGFVEPDVVITLPTREQLEHPLNDYNGCIGQEICPELPTLRVAMLAFIAKVGRLRQQQEPYPAGAVFTCNSISVGVIVHHLPAHSNDTNDGIDEMTRQRRHAVYVFDSHLRDEEGRCGGGDVNGKACLLCFDEDIDSLIDHLRHVVGATDYDEMPYNLTPLIVKTSKRWTDVAPEFRLTVDNVVCAPSEPTHDARPRRSRRSSTVRASNRPVVAAAVAVTSVANSGTPSVSSLASKRRRINGNIYLGETRGNVQEFILSPLRNECPHCHALFYDEEKNRPCCRKGKIMLPFRLKSDLPPLLAALYDGSHPLSEHFLSKLRAYNNQSSMASMGADTVQLQPGAGNSYPVLVIGGVVYHKIADVDPAQMKFGSIYFCDPDDVRADQARNANAQTFKLNVGLLRSLHAMIRSIHPAANLLQTMGETLRQAQQQGHVPDMFIKFHLNRTVNRSTHNAPVSENEVGAVFVGDFDDIPAPGQLCIHVRRPGSLSANLRCLPATSPYADPLCYPLLYPNGEFGWHIDMQLVLDDDEQVVAKRKRVTMREHDNFRIMVRPEHIEYNHVFLARRLNQQKAIDTYIKQEGERLTFIKFNQPKLRADSYAGLIDHVRRRQEALNADAAANVTSEVSSNNVTPAAASAAAEKANGDRRCGRMCILPSTFQGGRRHMECCYQDAMTITAKFGRPSLFITMTCNPKWLEIRSHLKPNETAQDRPDIVVRVFHTKMRHLVHEIKAGKVFRGATAYVYTVEFQKRGLPHMHMLLFLDEAHRPRQPDQVDKIISAELPDPVSEPELHAKVSAFMMHGPCGELRESAACNKKGPRKTDKCKCSKGFPKPFADVTEMDPNGRVLMYRRRRDDRSICKTSGGDTFMFNNSHVASYNPYLLERFNCHINVDIVSGTQSVKYLYKYITKGHDQALISAEDRAKLKAAQDAGDEVSAYVFTRFIGSCEATWRIMAFALTGRSHSVTKLAVHLPGEKNIVFREEDIEGAIVRGANKPSTLEAFFELNSRIAAGREAAATSRKLLYAEVPLLYCCQPSSGLWKRRVRNIQVLSRMHTISPRWVEKFFLRLLLLNCRGPTSFDDLKTIDGVHYATFKEAAIAAGITRSDDTWRQTMLEVVATRFPTTIRKVFCYLVANCQVTNARALWDEFLPDMTAGYLRRGATPERAERRAIRWTDHFLKMIGYSNGVSELGLQVDNVAGDDADDHDDDDNIAEDDINPISSSTINQQQEQLHSDNTVERLNAEQRRVYNHILASIDGDDTLGARAKCFYLQGCGGTGKTFVYNALLETLAQRKLPALAVAFTGIAASLLRGGITAHSAFKLPVPINADSTSWLKFGTKDAAKLARVRLIVWDEVSMTSKYMLNVVDRLLRDLHKRPNVAFGGVCIVLGGDLRQVLPIATSRVASQELCFVHCDAWRNFQVHELQTNMRVVPETNQSVDAAAAPVPPFSEWLIRLGDGDLQKDIHPQLHLPYDTIALPSQVISNDLATDVFGDDVVCSGDLARWAAVVLDRAILCPRNEDCNRMNDMLLNMFPGEQTELFSVDTIESENPDDIAEHPTEHLNMLHATGIPEHRIVLKVGAPIMLVKNMSRSEGLINGTRLIVKAIGHHILTCEIAFGKFRGAIVVLPRVDFKSQEGEFSFFLKRRQFPIRLCFAITINKAQGQTFERVGIYLPRTVFAHGQLYVAFSRARRWADVKVCVVDVEDQQGIMLRNDPTIYTLNVVNRSVLQAVRSRIMR